MNFSIRPRRPPLETFGLSEKWPLESQGSETNEAKSALDVVLVRSMALSSFFEYSQLDNASQILGNYLTIVINFSLLEQGHV